MNSSNAIGNVINIGSNFEISIGDTVQLISDVMGKKVIVEPDSVRMRPEKSEVDRLWADNTKAKQLLGWEPMYSGREGLKSGLTETVEWFTNSNNLEKYKIDIYNI
jgi:dTDP-glucose 4,6-dehydratase